MEAVTRRSADPAQLAEAVAAASLAARMPSAALFDDISYLLAAVSVQLPCKLSMQSSAVTRRLRCPLNAAYMLPDGRAT